MWIRQRLVPNIWGHHHSNFTKLYKLWYSEHAFPVSIQTADIFCLKKSGDGGDPLNYRPFALLNTDYKISTYLLTTQLRLPLAQRISVYQNGVVPGRQIHTPIDFLIAVPKMAARTTAARKAIALLLAFAKAYGTLDRGYLC
ncbi:unnamed protein product [Phytophthora fragariaefolia]|uniref:Unnamed protein product n=1 Tax=Phytophthora fragariaefolia TaxID=1490495 RepID=A0A9W6XZY7_9STRA|nr:unnamed protein product [Phytophthora fragariaefolia]